MHDIDARLSHAFVGYRQEKAVDTQDHAKTQEKSLTVARLKQEIIPGLFAEPRNIGTYAQHSEQSNALNEFSSLMEKGSVGHLSQAIEAIVAMLSDADPRKITKPRAGVKGWLDSFLGRDLETEMRYQQARTSLDEKIAEAENIAEHVRDTLTSIHNLMEQHTTEAESLRVHIQAGREYLAEMETTGEAGHNDPTQFDRPAERFSRKITNLAALEASHNMSLMQLKLTQAQAVDMLDRFTETTRVLIPVWRQHSLALLTNSKMSPAMMAQANAAHEALMKSLSNSLAEHHK